MNPTHHGALLLDGASQDHILAWLYQHYPSHQPLPLLLETPYAALQESGPILLDAPRHSPLYEGWSSGVTELRHGLWLEARLPAEQLFHCLQRRLQVRSPDSRKFWLRLGDARPLLRAWKAGVEWPRGFWHGIDVLWMRHAQGPIPTWRNHQPELDLVTASDSFDAHITLSWPLLGALTEEPEPSQETDQ
ncbi:DUF4123 domain-containing protein [Pseudomonas protegens]|uniref:DUF4123 domain-containing protein n=1 Tax=Pseudomonas protegens TaxID=380021 RepID=A0A7G7X9F4_9PSED|nr:DUF4123 domain-containing protein [Pseudomonas protegens]QNH76599.1 DUF4123 domain-containing protein [Pseudomonas protegens]QNL05793.1 DUF4123 domain-containing protein [Pseudomonas protegens]